VEITSPFQNWTTAISSSLNQRREIVKLLKPSRDSSLEKLQASRLLGTVEKAATLFLTEEMGMFYDYLYLAYSGGTSSQH